MANYDPFPTDLTFRTRMKKYYWNTYDDLINCTKKIYPLAAYHMFKYYNIFNKINEIEINETVNDRLDDIINNTNLMYAIREESNEYDEIEIDW